MNYKNLKVYLINLEVDLNKYFILIEIINN